MSTINFFCITMILIALLRTNSAFVVTPSHHATSKSIKNNRNVAVSLTPVDVADATSIIPEMPSILLAKYNAKSIGMEFAAKKAEAVAANVNPDVKAQVLSDGSHLLIDFPNLINSTTKTKATKTRLRTRYAQIAGRLMILGIGMLPGHGFPPEELAVQLIFLGMSFKPVVRSFQLYKCRFEASANCTEDDCPLELACDLCTEDECPLDLE